MTNFKIKNKQKRTVKTFVYLGLFLTVLEIYFIYADEHDFKYDIKYAAIFLLIFFIISCFTIAYMFHLRSKKLEQLLNGSKLIAHWKMDKKLTKLYVNELYLRKSGFNKIVFIVIASMFVLISIVFLFILEEGEYSTFYGIIFTILLILAFFAFFVPPFLKYLNKKGDRMVLIGKKFAYVNGFFHNWDFPLSGIEKVEVITKPFRGISIEYYYNDGNLRHSEQIQIPAVSSVDLQALANKLTE